ncbi:hypothetical protein UPYG_G00036790, partial [Umbra pygmaea]
MCCGQGGQNLVAAMPPGGHYHSVHCEPTQTLHLQQDSEQRQDSRSSAFQRSLASPDPCGNSNGTRTLPLPYPIKQETSTGYKSSQTTGLQATTQVGFQSGRGSMGVCRGEMEGPLGRRGGSSSGKALSAEAAYPFNNEDGSSPLPLSPGASRHSARLLSASSLKRRCLSLASQSATTSGNSASAVANAVITAAEGIDITAIICSSQMSVVACVNGLRTNSSSLPSSGFSTKTSPRRPPPPHQQQRGPQLSSSQGNCQLPSPAACLLSLSPDSTSSSVSSLEPEQQNQTQGPCEEPGSMQPGPGGRGSEGLGL